MFMETVLFETVLFYSEEEVYCYSYLKLYILINDFQLIYARNRSHSVTRSHKE